MKSIFYIRFIKWVILLVASFWFLGCTPTKIKSQESNYQYNNKIKDLNPKYLIYHENDTISYLYFEIETKNLLYTRESSNKPFEAKVSIEYEIYENYNGKILLDKGSKDLFDYKTVAGNKRILARIPIKFKLGERAVMKVIASDFYKKIKTQEVIEIDKKNKLSGQFFLIKDRKTGDICFDNYFTTNNDLEIESSINPNTSFIIDYFNTDYPPSKPPFSRNKLVEIPAIKDSSLVLSIENGKGNIVLDRLGSYFVRSFDSVSYSLTFQRLDTNFRSFYSYSGLIGPLKYICTSAEYKSLQESGNKRKAVEEFWITVAGSKERAKVVIEEYYRRVELANKFFTSYKEGWKTDRGMLSIVMGLPNTIYKNTFGETWIYGTPHNMMMSLTFTFNKENEEKADNDYQLTRYRTYRDYWYRACESWRRGRIYNFN